MLPLFHEYQVNHPRFKEHLRVAFGMAMVAPVCAIIFFRTLGWWNPWLWGSCVIGLSLVLCLYSVIGIHRNPRKLSRTGKNLVANSKRWFPYFFVIVQSLIASLIVMFVWFSTTSLALEVPLYVHVLLIFIAMLIPARRYVWANVSRTSPVVFDRWNEVLRAVWQVTVTTFATRTIIGMTINTQDIATENVVWQVFLWVPASLYMVFTIVITADHLYHSKEKKTRSSTPKVLNVPQIDREEKF